jgi:hypothetical protein
MRRHPDGVQSNLREAKAFACKEEILTLLKRTSVTFHLVEILDCYVWHICFGNGLSCAVCVVPSNEKEISHGRVSWQDCWRSFPQGYSLRYGLQLLLRPLKVLLHSCPARRRLLLKISVTSVGGEKRKLLLHQANESIKRFHQRVTLLFARLAVGVAAAFLLEQFGGGLNLRPLLLNQVAQGKRLRG